MRVSVVASVVQEELSEGRKQRENGRIGRGLCVPDRPEGRGRLSGEGREESRGRTRRKTRKEKRQLAAVRCVLLSSFFFLGFLFIRCDPEGQFSQ